MSKGRKFILDDGNKAAYMLAERISEDLSPHKYNPAVIYGKSGNGKTHLVNIIRDNLLKKEKNVVVLTGEQILAELIFDIKNVPNFSIVRFCERFQKLDVLIVEDIQYIEAKVGVQECMINIANYFVEHDKQILFTMNCDPNALDKFNMQLKEKFMESIQLEIKDSTEELRINILEKFCEEKGWKISEILKQQIATVTKTPAEVLGVMKHMMFYIEEMNCSLNQELVEKVLKERKLN